MALEAAPTPEVRQGDPAQGPRDRRRPRAERPLHLSRTVSAFKQALTEPREGTGSKSVVLALSAATYLDSSALGLRLLMRERAGGADVERVIRRPSETVRKLTLVVNFDRRFEIQG